MKENMPESVTTVELANEFPEHARLAMGIIAGWNKIERHLANLLADLTGMSMWQAVLVQSAVISPLAKIELVYAAGKHFLQFGQPKLMKELDDLYGILVRRLGVRNIYAHGLYVKNQDGYLHILRTRYDWPNDPQSSMRVSRKSLQTELESMESVTGKIIKLGNEISLSKANPELRATWLSVLVQQVDQDQSSRE